MFNDFQKSNPEVKGVKILNHIIGGQKVDPFYVIYNAKSFYGPGSLSKTQTQPTTPVTGERIIEAKFAQQGTSFEIEVRGVNRDFLLTWNRNNPKASLFSEKTKNGEYTTSAEYPSEQAIKKLVDKYVPESLIKLIDKWTAASKLPAGQVLDAQESIEKEINAELAKLKGKKVAPQPTVTAPAVVQAPAAAVPAVAQTLTDAPVDALPADLFGVPSPVPQKPVSSTIELPAALAKYAVSPEKAAELNSMNPTGAPMQDLGDEIQRMCNPNI